MCFLFLFQEHLFEVCGCVDATLGLTLTGKPICLSLAQIGCNLNQFYLFYQNNLKEKCSPQCPLECESQSFVLTLSNSDYPTRGYADQLINHSTTMSKFYANLSAITYEQLKRNILSVNIYYNDYKYVSIEELEKMSFIDLISAIGGTLGLFLGISFLSFFELLDIAIETIYILKENKKPKIANNTI